jgi:glycine C-acetyltransferase
MSLKSPASQRLVAHVEQQLAGLKAEGLFKEERRIVSPQAASITLENGADVINLCANNYLGLASHPALIMAAKRALDARGFGMASVRFICGTQDLHLDLEQEISAFLGTEGAVLYNSCFDANGGFFEALLGENDVIISDALNHASIIDGIRLCKAQRRVYANNDMQELEHHLKETAGARVRLIATDGVFSMDGVIANLAGVCNLARRYDALVFVDDSHAVGILGPGGRGTPAYCGVADQIDALTGTLGKALGGAAGGYTATARPVADWLRQRSRPYLFSNSLPPPIAATTLAALQMIAQGDDLRIKLARHADHFRAEMTRLGFRLLGNGHPIIPVLLGDARLAKEMSGRLLAEGVFVIGFSYPVVPKGAARIRTQMSAALSDQQVENAIAAFAKVGRSLGVI